MTMQQAAATTAGQSLLRAQDRADIAQSVRDAQATVRDAQQIAARAQHEAVQTVPAVPPIPAVPGGGNTGVIKDGNGRIVVTGPSGKTITIDPRAGLNGDQIQEMVQTALQPVPPAMRPDRGIPGELIPLAAIIFPCLVIMVTIITRTFAGRRATAGPTTAVLPPDAAARLARIEQAVEAVAIEVERISEAQRYSAQLLTDRLRDTVPAIPGARAEGQRAS